MQTHAAHLARTLVARGHTVEVLTYRVSTRIERADAPAYDAALPYRVHRALTRISHAHNLDLIEAHVTRFNPDVMYASTVFYGEIRARCGVPVVARSVGNDVLRPWIVYPFRPLARLVSTRWFEDRAYRFFRSLDYPERLEAVWRAARRRRMVASARCHSAILANSEFTEGLLHDIGVAATRVRRVIGGVDASRFADRKPADKARLRAAYGIDPDAWLLLTACRLVKKKGVDFLIDSMARVRGAIPHAHLLIVGSGKEFKRLRKRAARTETAEHITFAGRVPHTAVADLYGMADVFVLASRVWIDPSTGLRDVETMGRVLCEANAAGIPVVAARSGGIPSVIDDGQNGLLFPPDDPDGLTRALVSLAGQPDLRGHLVTNGRRSARERFDWQHIVDAHEDTFVGVLNTVGGSQ